MGEVTEQAVLILAKELGRLADSIDHLAVASQALGFPQSMVVAAPAGAPPPPNAASGPPGASPGKPEKTRQQKMSAKVFAICKKNDWSISDIGARVLQRDMPEDSRTWSEGDLGAVLDQMKEWGYP